MHNLDCGDIANVYIDYIAAFHFGGYPPIQIYRQSIP